MTTLSDLIKKIPLLNIFFTQKLKIKIVKVSSV